MPALDRMLELIGDQSPMDCLWNFMGASGALHDLRRPRGTDRRVAAHDPAPPCSDPDRAAVMSQVSMLDSPRRAGEDLFVELPAPRRPHRPDAGKLAAILSARGRPGPHLAFPLVCRALCRWSPWRQFRASWTDRQEWDEDMRQPSPLAGIWNVDEMSIDGVAVRR